MSKQSAMKHLVGIIDAMPIEDLWGNDIFYNCIIKPVLRNACTEMAIVEGTKNRMDVTKPLMLDKETYDSCVEQIMSIIEEKHWEAERSSRTEQWIKDCAPLIKICREADIELLDDEFYEDVVWCYLHTACEVYPTDEKGFQCLGTHHLDGAMYQFMQDYILTILRSRGFEY